MIEQGIVEKIEENIAIVKIYKNASCDNCNLCESGGQPDERILKVKNILSSKKGDWVQIQIPSSTIVKSAFMIFFLPVVSLILGYFIGQTLGNAMEIYTDIPSIGSALLFTALSFWVIRKYDSKMSRDDKNLPMMIKILNGNQQKTG